MSREIVADRISSPDSWLNLLYSFLSVLHCHDHCLRLRRRSGRSALRIPGNGTSPIFMVTLESFFHLCIILYGMISIANSFGRTLRRLLTSISIAKMTQERNLWTAFRQLSSAAELMALKTTQPRGKLSLQAAMVKLRDAPTNWGSRSRPFRAQWPLLLSSFWFSWWVLLGANGMYICHFLEIESALMIGHDRSFSCLRNYLEWLKWFKFVHWEMGYPDLRSLYHNAWS